MEWKNLKKVIVCSVVGLLGLLSAAMGFAAEATRIQASQIRVSPSFKCIYPSSPATSLGLGAALAISIAQIIVGSSAIGLSEYSTHVSYRSNSKWRSGKACLYASCVAFIYALVRLIAGAEVLADREENGNGNHVGNTVRCYIVKPGVYATGAVMSLAAVGLGVLAYLTMDSAKTTDNNSLGGAAAAAPSQGGFAIGHPQFPPPQYLPPQVPPPPNKGAAPSEATQPAESRPLLAHEFSSQV